MTQPQTTIDHNDSPTNADRSRASRRTFVGSAATLSTLAVAGCMGFDSGGAATETATDTPMMTETSTMTPTKEPTEEMEAVPDVPVLNYALTLEHLENAFYRDGLDEFADDELIEADVLSPFSESLRMDIPGHLESVGAHEAAHVKALTDVVKQLGATPVEEAEYDFGYETPSEFLGVAKALENTGVAAYAGPAPTVKNDDIFAAALGIHSVEARHASVLNELNVSSPFPAGVDESMSMSEEEEIAGQCIVG